jgi:hypothetical protein
LRASGGEVLVFCPEALHRLMARLGVAVVGSSPDPEAVRSDYWVLLGSLPLRLGVTLEALPPPAGFPGLAMGSGGVGVMAQGSRALVDDQRSLPARYAPRLLKLGYDLSPDATGATDFEATAEIIAGLDLVISVDTAVAHLAASLGKPTWVLLPARGADWRWLRGRDDSPWYPSARLIRQRAVGDWEPVLRRVETALANR